MFIWQPPSHTFQKTYVIVMMCQYLQRVFCQYDLLAAAQYWRWKYYDRFSMENVSLYLSNSWFWTRKCNSVSKVFFSNVHFREWNFKLNVIQIFNKNVNTYWFCIACFALDINWQCFSQKMLCYSIVSKLTSIVFKGFQLFQYNILFYSVLTFDLGKNVLNKTGN